MKIGCFFFFVLFLFFLHISNPSLITLHHILITPIFTHSQFSKEVVTNSMTWICLMTPTEIIPFLFFFSQKKSIDCSDCFFFFFIKICFIYLSILSSCLFQLKTFLILKAFDVNICPHHPSDLFPAGRRNLKKLKIILRFLLLILFFLFFFFFFACLSL